MKLNITACVLVAGLVLFSMVGMAGATPIQWTTGDGANNHLYDVISTNAYISWESASAAATLSGWHLVTITTSFEDRFVATLLSNQKSTRAEYYWLGGYQPAGSAEPAGGWSWVTGEAWSYTNWTAGNPNNGGGGAVQNYLHYWPEGLWQWDDMDNRSIMTGYVVEMTPVPEPSTLLLVGVSFVGLAVYRRKSKN